MNPFPGLFDGTAGSAARRGLRGSRHLGSPALLGLATLGLATLTCAGCGRPPQQERFPLHGTVLVAGAAVKQGAITLLPAAGNSGPAASTVIRDGRYAFDEQSGPGDGPHRVIIAVDAVAASDAPADDAADDAGAPELATLKRSPARSAGTSRRPGASKQEPPGGTSATGQWETTYTVPSQGEFLKNFELTYPAR